MLKKTALKDLCHMHGHLPTKQIFERRINFCMTYCSQNRTNYAILFWQHEKKMEDLNWM